MAKMKKEETTFEQKMAIGTLYKDNWKPAAIARALKLNRKTVFCVLCNMALVEA